MSKIRDVSESERGPSDPAATVDVDGYGRLGKVIFAQACHDLDFAARRPAARRFLMGWDKSFWAASLFQPGDDVNMAMLRKAVKLRCQRPCQNTAPRPRD